MVVEAKCSMISDETRNRSEQEMISFFRSIPARFEGSFGLMGGWAVTISRRAQAPVFRHGVSELRHGRTRNRAPLETAEGLIACL